MAHYIMVTEHAPEELNAWLRLAMEPGLSRPAARHLLKELGLPQHIFASAAGVLARHVPHDVAAGLAAPASPDIQAAIDTSRQLLASPHHHLITLADAAYPSKLFDTADPPLMLFLRGNPSLLARPAVAVIGARSATEGGKDNARAFARHLAGRGWTIISGLALGIDGASHEGALQAGPQGGGTIAVLASGIDICYPRQHAALAENIAATGLLVSEYPPGTPARPFRFPDRNRLVAGLSQGVLVVEAAAQSGSLLTARLALECGREVFAIPGSIHAPLSRGCHALIRQGAKLVEQGRDIEEELTRAGQTLQPESRSDPPPRSRQLTIDLPAPVSPSPAVTGQPAATRPTSRMLKDPTVAKVLAALGYDPVDTDLLCCRSGLEFSRIAAILTELELNDVIQRLADGRYLRKD